MAETTVKITRIRADEAGASYFEEEQVPMSLVEIVPGTPSLYISQPAVAKHLFSINPAGWAGDMHVAPRRQYVIILAGELQVTVGNGEMRSFRAGDIVLAEDTTGDGHKTVNPRDEPVVCSVVQLD